MRSFGYFNFCGTPTCIFAADSDIVFAGHHAEIFYR